MIQPWMNHETHESIIKHFPSTRTASKLSQSSISSIFQFLTSTHYTADGLISSAFRRSKRFFLETKETLELLH